MKKLIALALVVVACHGAAAPRSSAAPESPVRGNLVTGAPDAQSAIKAFLAASESQDLQALGGVFGTATGSARDAIPRDELEKRELTMLCYLRHDKYEILSDAPGTAGTRVFAVQFTRGALTRSANFDAVQGPAGRWYVQDFDMPALTDLCKQKG
ncbi:MAG TPA: hypothetical protein VMH39_14535 [Gemmatimonadaceae bacterium]|nr:hypothetical protein [Gemmatimonadaceae bacterium]